MRGGNRKEKAGARTGQELEKCWVAASYCALPYTVSFGMPYTSSISCTTVYHFVARHTVYCGIPFSPCTLIYRVLRDTVYFGIPCVWYMVYFVTNTAV